MDGDATYPFRPRNQLFHHLLLLEVVNPDCLLRTDEEQRFRGMKNHALNRAASFHFSEGF
jgi:hypothetical protein